MQPAITARGISSSWNWFCTRTWGAGRPHVWLCHARLVILVFLLTLHWCHDVRWIMFSNCSLTAAWPTVPSKHWDVLWKSIQKPHGLLWHVMLQTKSLVTIYLFCMMSKLAVDEIASSKSMSLFVLCIVIVFCILLCCFRSVWRIKIYITLIILDELHNCTYNYRYRPIGV